LNVLLNTAVKTSCRDAVDLLLVGVKEFLAQNKDADGPVSIRLEQAVDGLDLLPWLNAQTGETKIFWSDRESSYRMAGLGKSDEIRVGNPSQIEEKLTFIENRLNVLPHGMRYYGGVRFGSADVPDSDWSDFGICQFVLPQIELYLFNEKQFLVVNLVAESGEKLAENISVVCDRLEALSFDADVLNLMVAGTVRETIPSRTEWDRRIKVVLDALTAGKLGKVVLARKLVLDFEKKPNHLSILNSVGFGFGHHFGFSFQFGLGSGFFGYSPEILFSREGRVIHTEAVAGTRPRGKTAAEDDALEASLVESVKDRREHQYVIDMLRNSVEGLCVSHREPSEVAVIKLEKVQHLIHQFFGQLKEGVSTFDLLKTLHPTPAVSGYPVKESLAMLGKLEEFDRGWYSGVVGWIGKDASQFAVAIRSGLVSGNSVSLFSGAGIVEGSTADEEWAELDHKIAHYASLIEES